MGGKAQAGAGREGGLSLELFESQWKLHVGYRGGLHVISPPENREAPIISNSLLCA